MSMDCKSRADVDGGGISGHIHDLSPGPLPFELANVLGEVELEGRSLGALVFASRHLLRIKLSRPGLWTIYTPSDCACSCRVSRSPDVLGVPWMTGAGLIHFALS